jgi:hypothetical protein
VAFDGDESLLLKVELVAGLLMSRQKLTWRLVKMVKLIVLSFE